MALTGLDLKKIFANPHMVQHQHDTEFAQAKVRLGISFVVAIYMVLVIWFGWPEFGLAPEILTYIVAFFAASLTLAYTIRQRPGVDHLRRACAMVLDYGSITLVISAGGAVMSPVFATLLWVTVGYGIRYGTVYLTIGTGLALTSIALVAALSPYWSDLPYIMATMAVMTIMVPAYAYVLLTGIREAYDDAISANVAKSRFLAQASHDLRQPVHAISLFTACLRDSGLVEDQRKMVENIDRSLNSVARLFRSLLDISTLDSGKVRPRKELVALNELIRDVVDQNAELAKQAKVEFRIVPSALCFSTDPALMTTVLQNVISNSIKYAPNQPVLIGCRRRHGTVSIVICDRGPGIAAEDQGRVFDEFYRSPDQKHTTEGIGLGLAILRRMAGLLGLNVQLVSRVGHGTTIEIGGIEPVLAKPFPLSRPTRHPATALQGMRVMLIEDDADVQLATQTLLERWGCVVQASDFVPEIPDPCDLILTDYDLERGTGMDCVRHARARLGSNVPAIIMTGHDPLLFAEKVSDKKIPILAKPLRPTQLRAALMAHKFRDASETGTVHIRS